MVDHVQEWETLLTDKVVLGGKRIRISPITETRRHPQGTHRESKDPPEDLVMQLKATCMLSEKDAAAEEIRECCTGHVVLV